MAFRIPPFVCTKDRPAPNPSCVRVVHPDAVVIDDIQKADGRHVWLVECPYCDKRFQVGLFDCDRGRDLIDADTLDDPG